VTVTGNRPERSSQLRLRFGCEWPAGQCASRLLGDVALPVRTGHSGDQAGGLQDTSTGCPAIGDAAYTKNATGVVGSVFCTVYQ